MLSPWRFAKVALASPDWATSKTSTLAAIRFVHCLKHGCSGVAGLAILFDKTDQTGSCAGNACDLPSRSFSENAGLVLLMGVLLRLGRFMCAAVGRLSSLAHGGGGWESNPPHAPRTRPWF